MNEKLNTDLLRLVRDAIDCVEHEFCQEDWFLDHACKTPGCVAGWTLKCAGWTADACRKAEDEGVVGREARRLLGFSEDLAGIMFDVSWPCDLEEIWPEDLDMDDLDAVMETQPGWDWIHYTPTREDAVAVLDRLIHEGKEPKQVHEAEDRVVDYIHLFEPVSAR